ncbi:c-type cytochrome [Nitrosophilus labii]|uniref:c-type cytochrome n=1 Tax=Nitrosophilus labii TaxID=2706014 RepID=UPI001656B1A2|nr:c-type cytochrome [Nitrosophilus labii]
MRYLLLILPFLLFLIYTVTKGEKSVFKENIIKNERSITKSEKEYLEELKIIDTPQYFEQYTIDVINNGSNILNYPSGAMDGGYVSKEDAKKIAAYMATLQGFKPSHPEWVKEGAMLFYGNCVGCHGVEGKGQKGAFPDLTRRPLLGIELRKKKIYEKLKKE